MSRVAKAIKNVKFSVFFYSLFILVQFFSRKIFLDNLGDDFMGLTATLQSFLGFLNLAELGIGTAVGFSLYRPLFENNQKEINNIINLFGYLYKKIGLAILLLSVVLSCFFPIIFNSVSFPLGLIYYVFFAYVVGSLLGYFYNYQMFLLQADQKNYVVDSYFQSFNLVKILLQAIIVFYYANFVAWVTLELVFALTYSFFLRKRIAREYPWLIEDKNTDRSILKKYPELIRKVKQITAHKLGSFVTNGTDQILIFIFISIETVAFFGNYQLVFGKLSALINTAFAGTSAGIGNLVAEKDGPTINKVFWEMMALRFFIAGILTITLLYTVDPFIFLWLGQKYVLGHKILLLFLINLFLMQIRVPVDHFKDAFGLFADTWAPLVQSVLNLGISLLLVKSLGLVGILLGTFVSLSLIVMVWRPFYVYKYGFKQRFWMYWAELAKMTGALLGSYYIIRFIAPPILFKEGLESFGLLALYGMKIFFLSVLVYCPILLVLSRGYRNFCMRMFQLIKK
jgi:O-antigen/teichoic acid export membrane protein